MHERKCPECGEIITANLESCPKCGCPLSESSPVPPESAPTPKYSVSSDPVPSSKTTKKKHSNKAEIASLILGVLIFIMGFSLWRTSPATQTHSAGNYAVPYAAFGGDFYTEIYAASDTMADALTDIDSGIEAVSVSTQSLAQGLYTCSGMITMAIGLMTISISLPKIKKS